MKQELGEQLNLESEIGSTEGVIEFDGCAHHWLIEPPNEQATSLGVCKSCRATKYFPNAVVNTQEKYGRFSKKKKGMARLRSMSLDLKPQHALNYGQDPVKEEPNG